MSVYHVVCRDCTFERVVDDADPSLGRRAELEATSIATKHTYETQDEVVCQEVA